MGALSPRLKSALIRCVLRALSLPESWRCDRVVTAHPAMARRPWTPRTPRRPETRGCRVRAESHTSQRFSERIGIFDVNRGQNRGQSMHRRARLRGRRGNSADILSRWLRMQDVLAAIYSPEVQQIEVPHCHEQSQCRALSFLRIYCVTGRTVGVSRQPRRSARLKS